MYKNLLRNISWITAILFFLGIFLLPDKVGTQTTVATSFIINLTTLACLLGLFSSVIAGLLTLITKRLVVVRRIFNASAGILLFIHFTTGLFIESNSSGSDSLGSLCNLSLLEVVLVLALGASTACRMAAELISIIEYSKYSRKSVEPDLK